MPPLGLHTSDLLFPEEDGRARGLLPEPRRKALAPPEAGRGVPLLEAVRELPRRRRERDELAGKIQLYVLLEKASHPVYGLFGARGLLLAFAPEELPPDGVILFPLVPGVYVEEIGPVLVQLLPAAVVLDDRHPQGPYGPCRGLSENVARPVYPDPGPVRFSLGELPDSDVVPGSLESLTSIGFSSP
ncbi:hypothetical protein AKJ65_07160 [candidate division MSBL1 archaeon SCGC-AAA259E19]|uniref:Uncharacterized protein n=1 Tax=candidate division MSBL1 archaeon SCGC-AAA259E19 TaxID=1698264 RepID=A0A133UEQ7_9EURY|nr:hypothetical protein AKJ65_07160 [candidate division MSBL1 archaeon SCGC-AAA259E19]